MNPRAGFGPDTQVNYHGRILTEQGRSALRANSCSQPRPHAHTRRLQRYNSMVLAAPCPASRLRNRTFPACHLPPIFDKTP